MTIFLLYRFFRYDKFYSVVFVAIIMIFCINIILFFEEEVNAILDIAYFFMQDIYFINKDVYSIFIVNSYDYF